MKTKRTLTGLLVLLALTLSVPTETFAHGRHRHNHPHWVSRHQCRVETRHIYFPSYNVYYDLHSDLFIYLSGGNWVFGASLPLSFGHIDFAYEPIVELDFYEEMPYIYNDHHVVVYHDYHRHYGRVSYREYGHHHDYYRHHDRHDNGHHYGHYKNGHGNGHYKGGNGHGNGHGNYKKGNDGHGGNGNYNHDNNNRPKYGNRGNGSGNHRDGNYRDGGRGGNDNRGNYKAKSSTKSAYVKSDTKKPRESNNSRSGSVRTSNGRSR